MKFANQLFSLELILAFFALCGFYASATEPEIYIELNLSITQTNFRSATATWSSRCVFGKEKWLIESRFSRNAVEFFYCDGTNVYKTTQITHIPSNLPASLEQFKSPSLIGQTNLPKVADPIVLSIIPGLHPLSDTGGNLPWLAYCSGRYIQSPDQLIPLVAAIVRHDPSSFAFEHQEEVFSDGYGLPKKLSLICSEKLLKKSPFDVRILRTDDQVQSAKASGDWGVRIIDGMLAARYTVISATNIAGITVPTSFTYEQFQLGTNALVPWLRATGTAHDLRLSQEPKLIVSPGQPYTAVDYRFRSKERILDAIQYPITNGIVPAISDTKLQSLFKRVELGAERDRAAKRHYEAYLLFFVFLAGPVILFFDWRKKLKINNKKHENIVS